MKRTFLAGLLFLLTAVPAFPLGRQYGYAERGGATALTRLTGSSVSVQRSYPNAWITVYLTGTLTKATLYSDTSLTSLGNPFRADDAGFWTFWANDGYYDIECDGCGTLYNVHVGGFGMNDVRTFGAHCNGTDDDTSAIQLAATSSPDGTALLFPGGSSYQCNVTNTINITKPLTLTSAGGGKATILSNTPVSTEKLFNVTSSGVTFRDLIFDGSVATGRLTVRHVAVYFNGATRISDLRVEGCRFVNLSRKGVGNVAARIVTDATNASPIVITTGTAHNLVTGDTVTITGVLGNTAANVTKNAVTVIDGTHFSLDGTVGNGAYVAGGVVGSIINVSGNGVSPITITTGSNHGLTTGDRVTIVGVAGNTAANVSYSAITVTGARTFTIDGTTGNGDYTGGGGVGDYTGQGPHGDSATPGDASLASEYGVLALGCDRVWIERNTFTEISGCATFITHTSSVWIKDNDVGMLTTGDVLYPIHMDEAGSTAGDGITNVWVSGNHIHDGRRASGGAIDVMSQAAIPNVTGVKRVWISENLIENCPGYGSGTDIIRVLSCSDCHVVSNTIRQIPDGLVWYIDVDARVGVGTATADNPGPLRTIITGNTLVCGGAKQKGIRVRHTKIIGQVANTGYYAKIRGNFLVTDFTNYFSTGISTTDIPYIDIDGNTIDYNWQVASEYPIIVASSLKTVTAPRVTNNTINGYSVSANSRGILISAAGAGTPINQAVVSGNTIANLQSAAVQITANVNNATVYNNIFDNVATAPNVISDAGTNTSKYANHYVLTAALAGTWTITNGSASVTVNTAEVVAGDRIILNVTSANGSDKPVKAVGIVNGTSFVVRTVDQTNVVGADMTGTWRIDH